MFVRVNLVHFGMLAWLCAIGTCAVGGDIIDQRMAERHGLQRGWYTQVQMGAYSEIAGWELAYDELFVVTSTGTVHAIDANTGRTQWVNSVGNFDYPTVGPAVDRNYVAVMNGSTAYVLNRTNGAIFLEQRLAGAPGAAPVLASGYLYTPLARGRVVGYRLDGGMIPWHYQSFGRSLVSPLATPEGIVWGTTDGYLYAASGETPSIRYRLEAASTFGAAPRLQDDTVYAMSTRGELYALSLRNGAQQWKYATGYPSHRSPAVIGDRVYVTSAEPALHCVDATTGNGVWAARNVRQFAAASVNLIYGLDYLGDIAILDKASGARLGSIPVPGNATALVNDQSDRLVLISRRGLVQSLHAQGADQPNYYVANPAAEEVVEPATTKVAEEAPPATPPTEEVDEPAAEAAPVEEPIDDEDPFDAFLDDAENPFGFGDE